jgi:hypothetical protein
VAGKSEVDRKLATVTEIYIKLPFTYFSKKRFDLFLSNIIAPAD